jgi:plastocyanin
MLRWRRTVLAATVAGALVTGVTAGAALAADESVTIASFAFTPATVTISVGDSVTWTNQDGTAHTATASGTFDSGNLAGGASYTATFSTAGTFDYLCSIHPSMTGRVVVQAAGAGGAGSGGGGAGSGVTPPTDTLPAAVDDPDRGDRIVTATLAFLGLVMLAGTIVADRRFRGRGGQPER